MPERPNRPTFVQLGNHNTQHNHFYSPPAGPPINDDASHFESNTLEQFTLVARLASSSKHAGIVNAVAEQMNRRAFRPSGPVEDLLICLHLAPTIAKHGNWQLRRAFSHALGNTLAAGAGGQVVDRIFINFVELARASENFSVMLSIATTANHSTAQLLRNSTKDVYTYSHPQVLWQHSRYPTLCVAHTGLQPLVDSALDREDPWIKRKLVSSCLLALAQGSLTEIENTRRLLQALHDEDAQFLSLVLAWIEPIGHFDISSLLQPSLLNEIKNNHASATRLNPETLLTADSSLVRINLELLNLDLDLQKQKEPPVPNVSQTPNSGDSKGRYSTIEDITAYLLGSAHQEARESLVLDLLGSFDEGIRWAVASQFDLGLSQGRIGDGECAQIFALLADAHPWVIRESLTTLARCDLNLSDPNLRELARRAVAAVPRTQAQGWPRAELMPALASLLASEPTVAEYVDLAVRN
ncbi:hypothetical protein ACFFS2_41275 [Streptomyces aurantiacus]|uniref:hypothetical protein n=1 Tax=Streptomyces aurantiacus TaxID=47760 RepID=UPI000B2CEE00|nr:hypothetical protein [Streptomyces aurantiacus]